MRADDVGRRGAIFASKGRAAAYVSLAVLTSALFPFAVWVSRSGVLERDDFVWPIGIVPVAIATAFKLFRLEPAEKELSPRDCFCAAAARLGIGDRAGAAFFWILITIALVSFALFIFLPDGSA